MPLIRSRGPHACASSRAFLARHLCGGANVDGTFVTGMNMPGDALRSRTAAKVPVLIGTTSDHLPVVFPPRGNPLSFFGANSAAAQAVYLADVDPATAIKTIAVDMTMHDSARYVAAQAVADGQLGVVLPLRLCRRIPAPQRDRGARLGNPLLLRRRRRRVRVGHETDRPRRSF